MKAEDIERLDAIVNGASKLPIESQEYILSTIKGMLFTRNLLLKQNKPKQTNTKKPVT